MLSWQLRYKQIWKNENALTVSKGKRKYGQAARPISTSQLHTLLRFYLWPINLVVYQGPLGILRSGRSMS